MGEPMTYPPNRSTATAATAADKMMKVLEAEASAEHTPFYSVQQGMEKRSCRRA